MFNHRRFHFLIFVVEPCSLQVVVTAAPELGAGRLEVASVGTPGRREGSPLVPLLPHMVLGAKSSPRWVGLVWAEPGRVCGAQGSGVSGPRRAPLLSGQGAMGLLAWCPWWDTMVSGAFPWALGVPTCRGIFLVEFQLLSTGTLASGLPAAGVWAPCPGPSVSQVAVAFPLQGTWPVTAKVSPLFPSRRAPSRRRHPSASTEPCKPLRRFLGDSAQLNTVPPGRWNGDDWVPQLGHPHISLVCEASCSEACCQCRWPSAPGHGQTVTQDSPQFLPA